ncbi:MAG TPA: tetratricopeptide repeat protein [Candidatus Acidoferrales bacterium]|jgi:tetratricopeptide (TPR) repeat protein|nr:tetratricopeptide repeat protein [Candidatus Acidoferrales bacterium]
MRPTFCVRVIVRVRVIAIAAAGMLLQPGFLQTGFSQARGGATPPSTGAPATGTPSIGTTTRPPTSTTTTNPNNTSPSMPTPIYVSGRVMVDDGTPLPEAVTIQRVCNGAPHAEGYTDSKGFFAFELGNRNMAVQDASEFGGGGIGGGGMGGGGMGGGGFGGIGQSSQQSTAGGSMANSSTYSDRRFANCELQAKLAGYRSQVINLGNRRSMDDPNVGTILLHRVGTAEGNTVSAVSLAAPKDARKAYDRGMEALKKQKAEEARKDFAKAVELYPKYAAAWSELGKLQAPDDPEAARKSFGAAVEADPKFTGPYMHLAVLALHEKNWLEVAELTDRVVKLDPFDYPNAFFYNAVANYNLKRMEAAEQSAVQAEKLDTRHLMPQVNQLLGMLAAIRKDYTAAAAAFRNYLKIAPDGPEAATVRSQLVEAEKIVAGVAEMKQQDK